MAKSKAQIRGQDAWQRVAYLNQISQAVLLAGPDGRSANLARYYATVLKRICARLVLRLSPDAKRTICKRCNGVLIPGVSSTARVAKKEGQTAVVLRCRSCRFRRRYPVEKWKSRPGEDDDVTSDPAISDDHPI